MNMDKNSKEYIKFQTKFIRQEIAEERNCLIDGFRNITESIKQLNRILNLKGINLSTNNVDRLWHESISIYDNLLSTPNLHVNIGKVHTFKTYVAIGVLSYIKDYIELCTLVADEIEEDVKNTKVGIFTRLFGKPINKFSSMSESLAAGVDILQNFDSEYDKTSDLLKSLVAKTYAMRLDEIDPESLTEVYNTPGLNSLFDDANDFIESVNLFTAERDAFRKEYKDRIEFMEALKNLSTEEDEALKNAIINSGNELETESLANIRKSF